MWLGELVLSGSSTATTHRPIFSNRVTDFCQQTSRTNDARTLDRFLQGIEYQHSNHSIPLLSSLIFNQPSLLITFFHTFTITFAFFTPIRKFNTFSLFFSALQCIRTRLSLLSTSAPTILCMYHVYYDIYCYHIHIMYKSSVHGT